MKVIIYALFMFFIISCGHNKQENNTLAPKNIREISSIEELKNYGQKITSIESKYEYYFYLYRLTEANRLKQNNRLKDISLKNLLNVVDKVYEFNSEHKNISKVDMFDSLTKVNQTALLDALKEEFYFGFGVEVEELNKKADNYYDKEDERNVNPSFIAIRNERPSINSIEFYYLKMGDSLANIDLTIDETEFKRIETKINKKLGYEDLAVVRTNFVESIKKQKDHSYLVSFVVEHESGKEVRFEKDGVLQFLVSNELTIIPNTFEFKEARGNKKYKL